MNKAPEIYFYIKIFLPTLVWFSILLADHEFKHGKIPYLMDKATGNSVADFDRDFLKNN